MKKRKSKRFNTGGEAKPDWMVEDERGIESVYPEELLPIGRAAKGVKEAISARRVKNIVTEDDLLKKQTTSDMGFNLTERLPKNLDEITHAYRKMSRAEVEAAKEKGYFGKRPATTKRNWPADSKWWSPGDEKGSFGRAWNRGEDAETVRVPREKVSKNWAVRTKNAERLNKETGKYEPMKKGGAVKKYAKGGSVSSASSRADGCAQRGKTRGKLR